MMNTDNAASFYTYPEHEFLEHLNSEIKNLAQATSLLDKKIMSSGEMACYLIAKLNVIIDLMKAIQDYPSFSTVNAQLYKSKTTYIQRILETIREQTQKNFLDWQQQSFRQLANLQDIFESARKLLTKDLESHTMLAYFTQFNNFLLKAMDLVMEETTQNKDSVFSFTR